MTHGGLLNGGATEQKNQMKRLTNQTGYLVVNDQGGGT